MENQTKGSLIDQAIGIKNCGNNRDIYLQIIRLMLEYETGKGQIIKDSYAQEDWKLYGNEVHALKSSAAGIGAMTLSAEARALEGAVEREDYSYVKEHHEGFLELLGNVLTEIRAILGE